MKKADLISKLSDIEWEDFEVKTARAEVPKNSWQTVSPDISQRISET